MEISLIITIYNHCTLFQSYVSKYLNQLYNNSTLTKSYKGSAIADGDDPTLQKSSTVNGLK